MDSEFSREKIAEQLHKNWLVKVREEMERLLKEDAEKVNRLIGRTSELFEKEGKEKAFLYLNEQLKSAEKDTNEQENEQQASPAWIKTFKTITRDIPDLVSLPQDETRFQRKSSDSVFIGAGKFCKRTALGSQKGWNVLANSFRKLVSKEPGPPPQWTQQVPLQNVVRTHFLNADKWISEWDNAFRKLESSLLLSADNQMLKDSEYINESEQASDEEVQDDLFLPVDDSVEKQEFQGILDAAKAEAEQIKDQYHGNLGAFLKEIENGIFRAVTITGTIERPSKYYSERETEEAEHRAIQSIQERSQTWSTLRNALCNRLLLTINFIRLSEQVKERVGGFSASWDEFFESNLTQQLQDVENELDETIRVFEESEAHSMKEIRELSNSHREKISELIEHQLVSPLKEFTEEATLSNKLDRFTSAIPEWTKSLPEKAVLVEELNLEEIPPHYEFEEVKWQILV